ncbi:MAG: hypothetical protein QW297_00670 [Candidatus Jordarchaeales archaeon]
MMRGARGDNRTKRSLEKAEKLFGRGVEAEGRGDVREAGKRFKEASDIYASLGERGAFVNSELLRGHCIAFQALSERAADRFRGLIEEAIEVINEVRKGYIKDYTLRGVERDVWISYYVNFINALRVLLEENLPAKKDSCMKVIKEGETCVEWLERLEESEKAGLLLFWIGIACVRSASWFRGEEALNVLRKAAESFSKAGRFFEAARRPRHYLCLEMMRELCDVMLALEERGAPLQLKGLTAEPREERCRMIHKYNLTLLELYSAVRERFFAERQRRTYDALSNAREAAKGLEEVGDCGLAADAYFLLSKACYEAFKITLSNRRKRERLEECYEALKKAYMYARAQMKSDVNIKVLIMMARVISEYIKLVENDALKIRLIRDGASYSREALDEVRKVPEEAFIGEFYGSVASYLAAAAEAEVDEGRRRELLEKAVEYGEVALEYEEERLRRGDYLYCLAETYYMLGKCGQAGAFEKAGEVAKKARESFISAEDLVGAAGSFILSGNIQREIWRREKGGEGYLRARQEYLEAVRVASSMDWKEMEGEALVKLAELEDEKGNYAQASEYYIQALERFNKIMIEGREEEDIKERMKSVEARISIEKGKELLKSRLSEAASYFRKGGELLLKENKHEAMFYQSLSEFLEAEDVSMDKPREALERLKTASERLKALREMGGDKKAEALLRLCRGKEHLEEGLALYAEGAYSPALVKFSMAAKALGEAAKLGEGDWEKANGYVLFAQGLERFIRGQLGAHDEFLEAASLFNESTKILVTDKMKNAAFGFTDLCYGWRKFLEYIEGEEEKEDSYIEARMHLERSLKFFVEAGLSNYAKYVEGLGYLLDGERYIKKLESAGEAAEKYYALAEESYNKAKEKFSDAGYIGLEREVEEKIQKLREQEARRRYLEAVLGEGVSREDMENLRDGFVVVRVNEPADRSLFKVGDRITVKIELTNIGDANAIIERLENAVPQGFKFMGKAETVKDGDMVIRRELASWEKISLEIKIVAEKEQEVEYQPMVIFRDNKNRKRYFKPNPIRILIGEG